MLFRVLFTGVTLGAAVWVWAEAAFAAEWSITTKVNQRFVADDNLRMRTQNKEGVIGSTTSPESRYRYRSPVLDLNLYGRFDFSRFSDSAFNTEDQAIVAETSYRTQRSIWGFNADLDRDSTRTSEVTDTGRFEDIARRLRYSLRPSYSYQVSERDVARLNLGYTDVSYDTDSLTDYSYYTAGASWLNTFTQSTTLSLSVNAARQDTETDVKSDAYSALIGVTYVFSPRFNVSASAGPRYSEQKSPLAEESGVGVQFFTSASYRLSEQTSLSVSAGQSVEPSGAGSSRERRKVNFSAEHRYLPRLVFAFSTYFQDDSDPNGDSASSDRTYVGASPSVRWEVTQDLSLSASYRYRRQEIAGGDAADSNAVLVSLNYHPIAWFIDR